MRIQLSLVVLALTTGCSSYDCATHNVMGTVIGEQCGPFGHFGYTYFEDDMTWLILDVSSGDFLTDESAFTGEFLPFFNLGFRASHLEPGTSLDEGQLVASCSRTQGYGTGLYTWPAEVAKLEVVGESSRTVTSGQSWRFRWEVSCTAADMFSVGDDVIELEVSEVGWAFDLYGVPGDWPEEWE